MRDIVGFECWFYPIPKNGKLGKLVSYVMLFARSVRELLHASPKVVWVQLPQVPVLWAALVYRAMSMHTVKIVADCHNAQLRPPWSRFPLARWSLAKADAILVHNEAMLAKALEIGWPMNKVLVVEDVPASGKNAAPIGLAAEHIAAPKPWIVFPGSFAADEPIAEILAAARLLPECSFIITGRPERAKHHGHDLDSIPSNVVLPGFLPLDVFDDLLREADVVMGLTREEGIQLSVCNEALGFGKPLVASKTQILSKLFGAAAILVETANPEDIARGCKEALANPVHYSDKSLALSSARIDRWRSEQLSKLLLQIGESAD